MSEHTNTQQTKCEPATLCTQYNRLPDVCVPYVGALCHNCTPRIDNHTVTIGTTFPAPIHMSTRWCKPTCQGSPSVANTKASRGQQSSAAITHARLTHCASQLARLLLHSSVHPTQPHPLLTLTAWRKANTNSCGQHTCVSMARARSSTSQCAWPVGTVKAAGTSITWAPALRKPS